MTSAPSHTMAADEALSDKVRVSVKEVRYLPQHSDPDRGLWTWGYRIEVENLRDEKITLLKRSWQYRYGNYTVAPTLSDYVDGRNPLLYPAGDDRSRFSYVSGVPLPAPSGLMRGFFVFETEKGALLRAKIPAFTLSAPSDAKTPKFPRTARPSPKKDSAVLNAAVANYRARVQAGQHATLDLHDIGLSPRTRWEIEQFFFRNAYYAFNHEKRGHFTTGELSNAIKYLELNDLVIHYDDRYIKGTSTFISRTRLVILSNTLQIAVEAAARIAGVNPQDIADIGLRVADILRAVAQGVDWDKLLPQPKPSDMTTARQEITSRSRVDDVKYAQRLERYLERLAKAPLPSRESGPVTPEQARDASRLRSAFEAVRQCQKRLGLPKQEIDVRVREANRRRVEFDRSKRPKLKPQAACPALGAPRR